MTLTVSLMYKTIHHNLNPFLVTSSNGWDYVMSGAIELGLAFIDHFGCKLPPATSSDGATPLHKCCSLGAHILQDTFKVSIHHRIENASHVDNINYV